MPGYRILLCAIVLYSQIAAAHAQTDKWHETIIAPGVSFKTPAEPVRELHLDRIEAQGKDYGTSARTEYQYKNRDIRFYVESGIIPSVLFKTTDPGQHIREALSEVSTGLGVSTDAWKEFREINREGIRILTAKIPEVEDVVCIKIVLLKDRRLTTVVYGGPEKMAEPFLSSFRHP